jgi:hypothetical protein
MFGRVGQKRIDDLPGGGLRRARLNAPLPVMDPQKVATASLARR